MMTDFRYAGRLLLKSPGFALAAVLTLALGIGANTAIFSLVHATLLRPLPYQDSERLVELWGNVQRDVIERRGASWPDYKDWRTRSRSFDGIAAHWGASYTLFGGDEPERLQGEEVDGQYFKLLGVQPRVGRLLAEEDVRPNSPRTAVLAESLWRRRFGGDPTIGGRTIQLDQQSYIVAGVAPAWFRGRTGDAELWTPIKPDDPPQDRGSRWFAALAKLKPDVRVEQAQQEMNGISRQLEREYPNSNEKRGVEIAPLREELFGNVQPVLLLLLAAVGCVLLIACANVANLLLARSENRATEMAIRTALGAGRSRLFRQLIAESVVLAGCGAAVGLLLSQWAAEALLAASPVPFPEFVQPKLELSVGAFAMAISLITSVVLGLVPALSTSPSRLQTALRNASGRSTESSSRRRFRAALVAAEAAIALVLITGAGLFIENFRRLIAFDPGFRSDNVLSFSLSVRRVPPSQPASSNAGAPPIALAAATARLVHDTLRSLPSVRDVALTSGMPLTGEGGAIFYAAEGMSGVDARNRPRAYLHFVTPGFFRTMGIRMIRGRDFTENEIIDSPVCIVSENVTKRFWPGQDPIGKRIRPGRADSTTPWKTIVGVVAETNFRALPRNPTPDPDIYWPYHSQARQFAVLIRSDGNPSTLISAVRARMREIDPTAVLFNVATMQERVARQLTTARFLSWLMGLFAGIALVLAMIGVYGVMAWTVAQRTREIGVRIALGASRGEVVAMVARSGMAPVAIGAGLGLTASVALSGLIDRLLFGVRPADPVVLGLACVLLLVSALLAAWWPAHRATRIDPVVALRYE
jgi:putative ABC transport system permease protein